MTAAKPGRRAWLGAAVSSAVAVAAGAWVWRSSQRQAQALSEAEQAFWAGRWVQLDGANLAAESFAGQPLLLNFWATWCPPCVDELPLLNAFYNENKAKGWQVMGLAVDQVNPVRSFVARSPLAYPHAMAGYSGVDVAKSLGNASGALPFTVVFDAAGRVVQRKIGRVSPADLRAWRDGGPA